MTSLLGRPYMKVGSPPIDLSGCVFYAPLWRPDLGGSTFYDLAGHNLCTVYGATWGSQGRTFDGDDYISIPHSDSLNITGDLTIAIGFKVTSITSYRTLVIKGAEAGTPYELIFNDTVNQFFYLHQKVGGGNQQVVSSSNWVINTWWYLVLTRDVDGNISIYRNGVLDAAPTTTVGTPLSDSTNDILIGKRSDGYFFPGLISELLITNRVWNASEVMNNYQAWKASGRFN